MLNVKVDTKVSRFLWRHVAVVCTTTSLVLVTMATFGCGKAEPELPRELQELRRKPDMYETEVLGFQLEVPVGWTAQAKQTSAAFTVPGVTSGRVVIEMSVEPYSAGETADSVIKETMASFDKSKGSYMHQELLKCRFPGLEEISTTSQKKNGIPNRIFYLIATPAGKVSIIANFSGSADISTYQKQLHYLASSVNVP